MSQTDKEMLEFAAKAAGIDYEIVEGWSGPVVGYGMASRVWNPLTDDGDALRLAVKLDLLNDPRFLHERNVLMFTKNMPRLEATRRAFVQAAAAQSMA